VATFRLDERRAVLLATTVSALLHLLMIGSLPLVLTPDSGEYIRTAIGLADPAAAWSPHNRTPGYPVLLFAVFRLFGTGAGGIVVVQNLLAVGTCALLTWTASRLAGPRIGLVAGLLYAIEPWSLGFANYALTETTAAFCVVLAATLALVLRPRPAAAVAVGLAIALAALIRPAIVSMVLFFGLAFVLRGGVASRRRVALATVLLLSLVAAVAPWLRYNAARGVHGFAAGSGWALWYGVAMFDLLDPDYPVGDDIKALADRHLAHGVGDDAVIRVIQDSGAIESVAQGDRLGAWARASIVKHPAAYLASLPYALLWQLNAGIPGKPPMYDEVPYFLERLTRDPPAPSPAPNFQNPGALPGWQSFAMAWHGGVMQAYLRWAGSGTLRGLPQVPLFLCAIFGCVLAGWRRDWSVAAVLAGSLAFVAAHVALLQPVTRHALPAWTVWYLALAYVLRVATVALRRRRAQ
jgi:4-amino-4-deoxy-L-arabinose transferase-like glycosyltransferase